MKKIQICFFNSYLPFNLYLNIVYNKLTSDGYNVQKINNMNEYDNSSDYLILFLNFINNIYHYNNLIVNNTKIIFIHADYILNHNQEIQYYMINYINNINPSNTYIWDYNKLNLDYYSQLFTNKKYYFIPLSYSPFLELLYNKSNNYIHYNEKDIDVLFLGGMSKRRQNILDIVKKKYKLEIGSNISDIKEFCSLIERSKIVINIYSNEINKPFDYYRLSLLYSNKVFVISEKYEKVDYTIEPFLLELENVAVNVKYHELLSAVDKYMNSDYQVIENIVNNTYEVFKKYNMETNIDNFFSTLKMENDLKNN